MDDLGHIHMGVSENVVYPIVPNGFADPYPVLKWLAIIGNIHPTFSGPNPCDFNGSAVSEIRPPPNDSNDVRFNHGNA